jgi:hypothetical protein
MIELACDGQTSGPSADDNGVGAILDLCRHPRSPVVSWAARTGPPSTNTMQNRLRFMWAEQDRRTVDRSGTQPAVQLP